MIPQRMGRVRHGQYRIRRVVQRAGARLRIVHTVAGAHGRGYLLAQATEDGGRVAPGVCSCAAGAPVRAAELVTEDDFTVCGTCRRRLA